MILCDTNLLLYSAQPDSPQFNEALGFIQKSLVSGEQLVVFLQNLAEFWNVATRPRERNGLGLSIRRADAELDDILESVAVLPDHVKTAEIWRALVLQHEVRGVQVHDARLVEGMKAYGIGQIATYNGKDFIRYTGVTVLHPNDVF